MVAAGRHQTGAEIKKAARSAKRAAEKLKA
jgi:hypothetical protein